MVLTYKVILVGEPAVGKTSMLQKLYCNKFTLNRTCTIGMDYYNYLVDFSKQEPYILTGQVVLNLWDSAGQERFRTYIKAFFRGVAAIILIYDVTNRETFNKLDEWIKYLHDNLETPDDVDIYLVGNKTDLYRNVTFEEANNYALEHNLVYTETSANNGNYIDYLFNTIANGLLYKEHNFEARTKEQQDSDQKLRLVINNLAYKKKCPC